MHVDRRTGIRQNFTFNMEVQRSLLENNSYYGWFSSIACMGLQYWFADFGTIVAGSVIQAFEGRPYYRSMRLCKEGFNVLV